MLSHGIISGALFLCVGVVYDRMHTREIGAYGGLVERMPVYAVCFMVFTLANMGLPGTSGFIGEFLTMLGTFQVNTWVVIFAATGTILSAAYMLWLYGRIIFGALVKPALTAIQDLSAREIAIFTPLVVLTIAFGVYPKPIFDVTSASVANLVAQHKLAMMNRGKPADHLHLAFLNMPAKDPRGDTETRRKGSQGASEAVRQESRAFGAQSFSLSHRLIVNSSRSAPSAPPRAHPWEPPIGADSSSSYEDVR
jgi:NADH:ubiquinone oxidoreductase subunit 5 (subunit L)/multisubunit Na+/H+ antiporter MnhA subunit